MVDLDRWGGLADEHSSIALPTAEAAAGDGPGEAGVRRQLAAVFVDGQLVAVTRGVVVWFDYNRQKAQPIPEDVRAMIRSRERIKPDEPS